MPKLDKLRIPEEEKRYIRENINPILEEMVAKILVDKPEDAAEYMYQYLSVKLKKYVDNVASPVCVCSCI